MEQSTSIDVEASVERVWDVLREVERWPEWAPTVTSVRRLDDGPLAVVATGVVPRPARAPAGLLGMCPLHPNSPREAMVEMCTRPLLAGGNMGIAFVVPTVQEVRA